MLDDRFVSTSQWKPRYWGGPKRDPRPSVDCISSNYIDNAHFLRDHRASIWHRGTRRHETAADNCNSLCHRSLKILDLHFEDSAYLAFDDLGRRTSHNYRRRRDLCTDNGDRTPKGVHHFCTREVADSYCLIVAFLPHLESRSLIETYGYGEACTWMGGAGPKILHKEGDRRGADNQKKLAKPKIF